MKNVIEVLTLSCEYLQQKGITNPRRDVERLIAHVLSMSRLDLYLQFDRPLHKNELTVIREGLRRLLQHEPIQYIEGEVMFHHCAFFVTPSVLIPRPETEILVETCAAYICKLENEGICILDLCCGSGCIGISLKKAIPTAHVVMSDISPDALEIASRNAKRNNVDVEIIESNFFEKLSGRKFDCIVSNPPYVTEYEYIGLDKSVKDFEPKTALVAGVSGLECYEIIAADAKKYMKPLAMLFLEIGATQAAATDALFRKNGFSDVSVKRDFSDRDRFLVVGNGPKVTEI